MVRWGPRFEIVGARDNVLMGADLPESPSRYPQIAELDGVACRRKRSGNARTSFVGLGEKPVRAAYTRSVTGVGWGPSKARPYTVVPKAMRVANFILECVYYCCER
jgi:hypothetical protein